MSTTKIAAEICCWHIHGKLYIASKNFWIQSTHLELECQTDAVMEEVVRSKSFKDIVMEKLPYLRVGKFHLDIDWAIVANKQINTNITCVWHDVYSESSSVEIINELIGA